MIDISIGIEGSEEFKRKLGITISEVQNLKPVFEGPIKEYLKTEMKKQFSSQGSYGGSPWPSNSYKYNVWKSKKVGHTRLLEFSGRLKNSIIGNTMYSRYVTSKNSLEFGTSVPYAKYQNNGTNRGIKPKRIFAMTPGQKKALVTIIQRELLSIYEGK